MKVLNTKDNFESTIRKFKKKVAEGGILQEVMDRREYIKPSIQRKLRKGKAKSRWQRILKSQELPKKLF